MPDFDRIGEVADGEDPDAEMECPQCGGTIGVWLTEVGEEDVCAVTGYNHNHPEDYNE